MLRLVKERKFAKKLFREALILIGFFIAMLFVNFWLILGFRFCRIELSFDQAGSLGLYLIYSFAALYSIYLIIKVCIFIAIFSGNKLQKGRL